MGNNNFDVIIIGAGLSGIGAAYHLQKHCPSKTYAIFESRSALGGTWDLFRYPGIRSDSDMHTLGYNFKPWREAKSIADGPSILNYIQETADENNIASQIRYDHKLISANWSNVKNQWELSVHSAKNNEFLQYTCNFLQLCSGYFNYDEGFTPEFSGCENFKGQFIHPQKWPVNFNTEDKTIIVIGSGATAVTLVPSLAKTAKHVTMLQRSPTYVVSRPDRDFWANFLRKILPEMWAYTITRWKNIFMQQYFYRSARTNPEKVKETILKPLRKELGPDYDINKHFTPSYNPWDQRICLVPNSDLFKAIRSGEASVVTDTIETFTEDGLLLTSGEKLVADVIVSATGLNMVVLGGVKFSIDGNPIDFSKTFTYKGMMFSGVPNLASTFGYVNASWTLRADLNSEYLCRLLNYMDTNHFSRCVPTINKQEKTMEQRPWIDDFTPGYFQRTLELMPRQGDHSPWVNTQNFKADKKLLHHDKVDDGVMLFS